MDPNDILTIVAAVGGSLVVLGGGAWALLRPRRRQDEDHSTDADTQETPRPARADRPAKPTWGDTLTAAKTPPEAPAPSAPTTSDDNQPVDEPAAEQTEDVDGTDAAAEAPTQVADEAATPAPERSTTPAGEAAPAHIEQVDDTPSPATPQAEDTVDHAAPETETPEPAADRMVRLRSRLARSGTIGRGLLNLLSRGKIDENTWDEVEETLLLADLGPDATDELMGNLRQRLKIIGGDSPEAVREVLRDELVKLVDPNLDRRLAATRLTLDDGSTVPSVALMVGVNGTGKTTTVGKLARVLVSEGRTVVLGAADTFRAAAADQLATWGARVGVETVRSDRDGADPAAVAFDAVRRGVESEVDVVLIDTAGRLQNKKGLMDELGKVRRVAGKALGAGDIQEVLLVLDATTGQNGMQQARVFSEVVDVTGIVLTKLDGTAKGGIVVNVQRELGVPVKMVGLGEGVDDLAPFDPYGFVDALLD
ncbi:signal recognition particle-docking protein FtsY [Devriesea agamarum]|uniref:signal recognition particle-docking protein FtsY n=1 Tax=Devriesea agamarum TaxID=472569 RepID=UPI00071C2259|nr:signal recognition particle-docking protein FtsY [Devriesea agamarum]